MASTNRSFRYTTSTGLLLVERCNTIRLIRLPRGQEINLFGGRITVKHPCESLGYLLWHGTGDDRYFRSDCRKSVVKTKGTQAVIVSVVQSLLRTISASFLPTFRPATSSCWKVSLCCRARMYDAAVTFAPRILVERSWHLR